MVTAPRFARVPRKGYRAVVARRLFTFVQMELPWELGPADGRYLLRTRGGTADGEPEHVVVLATVGAERRRLLGGRSRTRRAEPEPAPSSVPVARATIVDAVPLSAEGQARAWLEQLDPEREALSAAGVLNRLLFAHRIAGAAPHVHEVSPAQALVLRAGFGEGEHVADGLWLDARELLLSHRRAGRRATVLRPQERLAALLSGREGALLCEELALRARVDLDGGRLALAAIELDRAYVATLAELPGEERPDLKERIDELEGLRPDVERAAHAALPAVAPAGGGTPIEARSSGTTRGGERVGAPREPGEQTIRHALERLEAALRARTAGGIRSS
jgi:hypothetical protein